MEKIEPRSSFVDLKGLRLHTLDWGGNGEPIVILHATGFLGRIYRPLAERLRAIGHVYSYDQRGHGDSSAAADGVYTWDATMRDLEDVITAMGWSGVRAIGHSAGATAIGSLACERPDL
ncbi:MAG TPA: alpha/beta hydrolase, partial [Candidatus Binatus sp.]|nr:alpha/beta hydrolase [Candidatus Binatus sp.]